MYYIKIEFQSPPPIPNNLKLSRVGELSAVSGNIENIAFFGEVIMKL